MWTWVLTNGIEILASGSWQGVIEEGEDLGLIERRFRQKDGFETSPRLLARGVMMLPASMCPAECEERAYG